MREMRCKGRVQGYVGGHDLPEERVNCEQKPSCMVWHEPEIWTVANSRGMA